MKALKLIVIAVVAYVSVVVAFESLIGFFQPANQSTLVITTSDANGDKSDRVLARLESDGQIYVAANHWPRAWYNEAIGNPNVQVTLDSTAGNGVAGDYLVVPVTGEEYERVEAEHRAGIGFRILTGFPERLFVRLDPR